MSLPVRALRRTDHHQVARRLALVLATACSAYWVRRLLGGAHGHHGYLQASVGPTAGSVAVYVTMFSRAGCPFCSRAKALLEQRGVRFGIVDVDLEPERKAQASELSGASTLPQIFVGRRCLSGFDALKRLDDKGELMDALTYRPDDGPAIDPTPAHLVAEQAGLLPEAVAAALKPKAEKLRGLDYEPGSRPSLRAFLKYAATRRPAQGQHGNVPLNLAAPPTEAAPPPALPKATALELATLLRQAMLRLLDLFRDPVSGDVDYVAMQGSEDWDMFLALASELSDKRLQGDLESMDEAGRKAFFINLYNAMVFHGVLTYGRRPGWWNLYCFFIAPAVSYSIAGVQASIDDVEHGLLRARPGYLQEGDQEFLRQLRMPAADPRIHMALVCAAKGCPAIGTYSAEGIEEELDGAVEAFVADDTKVQADEGSSEVALTELFKMYLEDFVGEASKAGTDEANKELVRWIARYAKGAKKDHLQSLLASDATPKVRWLPYDWNTNGPDLPLNKRIYTPVW